MNEMRAGLATQTQDKATARLLAQSVFELARHQSAGPSEGERAGKLAQALAQGADINARGAKKNEGQGSRPLHVAAVWAGPELIEAFLRSGADPNARRADGATPMHVAAARWDGAPLVELLARWGGDLDALDKEGAPPLARAFGWRADQNGFETARALLKAGASWPKQGVSAPYDFRWKAAQSRDGEALAFMAKEDANLQAAAGSPSLWMALVRGPGPSWRVDAARFEQCCQALDAAAVAGPSPLDSWRDDALCEALIHLPSVMQQRLAGSIGDFSTLWPERERRLMSIFESRSHDHLREALALGLDPTWRWASGSGLANVLCQAIGQSNYAFQAGAISLAASVGADLDEPDASGWRPLARALASRSHSNELVAELLDAGADPTLAAWPEGPSVFAYACGCRDPRHSNRTIWGAPTPRQSWEVDLARMIGMGADVNERAAGKPLLYWALRGELCCDVKILLDHGADRALALEALQEEGDRDYLGSLMDPPKKHQPSSPTELPWSLRRWLDAGASPSRLCQALERACENFPEGARWRNSSTMALLEAQALREHANSSKASAGAGGPRL